MSARRILVTGGVRSGKSAYAERPAGRPAGGHLRRPGSRSGPDHRSGVGESDRGASRAARRRTGRRWRPPMSRAPCGRPTAGPAVDCLGTWLTRLIDDAATGGNVPETSGRRTGRWPATCWSTRGAPFRTTPWRVTNEVGWGVVPAHASGRLFADLLGRVNQEMAACQRRGRADGRGPPAQPVAARSRHPESRRRTATPAAQNLRSEVSWLAAARGAARPGRDAVTSGPPAA